MIYEIKKRIFPIISKLRIYTSVCLFSVLFALLSAKLCLGTESIQSLDLSGNGPIFLSNKQIREDLTQAERLLRDNYIRYPILEQIGIRWHSVFRNLERYFLKDVNPILTHHFQKQLIKALEFTEDSNIQANLLLKKRHYFQRIEPKVAFYTGIRLAQQKQHFRVLPSHHHPKKIANHRFIGCSNSREVFFPILPQRQSELLFILGQQANHQLKPLNCTFESEAGVRHETFLPLIISESVLNSPETPIYEYVDGRIPYLRWYRDGKSKETSVKKFYKLARKLRKSQILIIDVRGNSNGSFSFIEKWLKEYTSSHWKNVILQERQTPQILKGLLNRVQWNLNRSSSRLLVGQDQLEQKSQQLRVLIDHFMKKEIDQKWVETKFIFNGNKDAPKWNTRLIVITNKYCGNGCQFLAALTKQIPDGTLIGTNTGPFPKNTSGPIFQLKHSHIMLSFGNRLHLNHLGKPVSTSGYLPDYWLFPPMGMSDIMRYASKLN